MSEKIELEKSKKLEASINKLIVESDLSFKTVDSVLSRILVINRDKGKNLLDAANIKQVVEMPRFNR